MKRGNVVRHLREAACASPRDTGKHEIYHNPANGMQSPVPRHNEINPIIVRKICRELGIAPPLGR